MLSHGSSVLLFCSLLGVTLFFLPSLGSVLFLCSGKQMRMRVALPVARFLHGNDS